MDNFDLKKYLAEGKLLKEEPKKPKFTDEQIKKEMDINVAQARTLVDYQSKGEFDWEDLVQDLLKIDKESIISQPEAFEEYIRGQEDVKLPNNSSGSFFVGLTNIEGLLDALGMGEEDDVDEEVWRKWQKYHRDEINKIKDWTKY